MRAHILILLHLLGLIACGPRRYELRPLPARLPEECLSRSDSSPSTHPTSMDLLGEWSLLITRTHFGDSSAPQSDVGRLWFLPWSSLSDRQLPDHFLSHFPIGGFHTNDLMALGASVPPPFQRLLLDNRGPRLLDPPTWDTNAVSGNVLQVGQDSAGRVAYWITGGGLDQGASFVLERATPNALVGTWSSRLWTTVPYAQGFWCARRLQALSPPNRRMDADGARP